MRYSTIIITKRKRLSMELNPLGQIFSLDNMWNLFESYRDGEIYGYDGQSIYWECLKCHKLTTRPELDLFQSNFGEINEFCLDCSKKEMTT